MKGRSHKEKKKFNPGEAVFSQEIIQNFSQQKGYTNIKDIWLNCEVFVHSKH